MFWQRTGGEGDLLSNLTENTFSLRAMKGVGVQSGFDSFRVSVNNRREWTSTAVGKVSHCRLKSKVPLRSW
jgi:hypothetical protein